jgi:PAS domain S-box-containing protein
MKSVHHMTPDEIDGRITEIQRNYVGFFKDARDGFYISTREGRFLDCNEALVKMLGYSLIEEGLALDLNRDLWMYPEHRITFQKIIEEHGYVQDYEAIFKRRDGQPLYVSLSSHVWKDHEGRVEGYRGFVVDHTEKKLMCDQLAATETKYTDLFENIQDGIFIADANGKVTDCNPAFCDIVGYTKAEFLEMNYYRDLFTSSEAVLDFRRKLTRTGVVKDYELRVRHKDGQLRDISMSGYAGRDGSGQIIGYRGLVRDTTERNRLQKQLIQAERLSAMGKMASQLAHELNNPIFGIMNCLELIKDAVPEDNYKRKFVDLAYNECKRTSILLMKMLKFFKPDDEKRTSTNVNKLLEETLLFYEKQFINLNIKVQTDLDPTLPSISAVESQLKQVFINMIINANAAMESGGLLLVSSRMEDGGENIVIRIEDTGVGISPENLDRIFDAFFTTKKEVLKGVGLGLSVCYGFIKEHGGTVDVESELGKGTRFTICLPVNAHRRALEQPTQQSLRSG